MHNSKNRTKARLRVLGVSLAAANLAAITPLSAADVQQGGRLAQRWCATCHVVAPGQGQAKADAPSFAAISAGRRVPEIQGFLQRSHPSMPDMNLSRSEIADLIAYMQTLAPPADPQQPEMQKDQPPKQFRG